MARKKAEQVQEVATVQADDLMDYTVVWGVKRDGRRYAAGETIRLRLEDAIPLIEAGAIRR